MAKNVLTQIKDTKIRTLLILGISIAFVIILILYFSLRQPPPKLTEQSVTSKVPEISAVPGGATSERYQQLLEEENRKRAEAARQAGTSAIATIIGGKKKEGSETFGIEGQLLASAQQCSCPPEGTGGSEVPDLDPVRAAQLIAELREHPERALQLLQQNPGLAKALCKQDPEFAYQTLEQHPEAAKIMLSECPDLAKQLAEKNPELFKKLMLENPELARQLAEKNPDLFKKLIQADPDFAKQLANKNPDLFKTLMKNDAEFSKFMAKTNPELVKNLMKNDSAFARQLASTAPDLVKNLMKEDPEFAKQLAATTPDLVKTLMKNDLEFAKQMAKSSPDLVKTLMKNDPVFAKQLLDSNPTLVKNLMKDDPEFAKQMATIHPDLVKKLMLADPEFAKILASNNPDLVKELMRNDPEFAKTLAQKSPGLNALLQGQGLNAQANRLRAQEEARRRARQEAGQPKILTEEQQKQKQILQTTMDNQAKSIFQAWNEYTPQVLVAGEAPDKAAQAGGSSTSSTTEGGTLSGGTTGQASGPALFKAGTIIFAVLDTAVNSDEPGPVLATIIEGPYRGAKLVGSVTTASQAGGLPPEKVTLSFSQMTLLDRPSTLAVQAVAIDPDTARTAVATDVDHHYLLRYGTLFASSLLTGYAQSITSQGTVQTTAANGQATTTTTPQLNDRKTIFAALGQVGNRLGQATANWFNIPPTITVDAGTGVGILFLSDVNG